MLKNILIGAPKTEPLLRIYPNYISFNAVAASLLGFNEGDAVSVMQDDRDGWVYVGNVHTKQSYVLSRQGSAFVVRCAPLCRRLAECLEGCGTYRISKDDATEFMGHTYYNIFKKKYGKDR